MNIYKQRIIDSENEFARKLNNVVKNEYSVYVEFMRFVFHYRSFNQLYELLGVDLKNKIKHEKKGDPSAREYIDNLIELAMKKNVFENLEKWMIKNYIKYEEALNYIMPDEFIYNIDINKFQASLKNNYKEKDDWKNILHFIRKVRNNILHGTKNIIDVFDDKNHNLRIKLYNEIIYQTIKGFTENHNFEKGVRFLKNNQNDSCVICDDERADKKYMISDNKDDIKTCIKCFAFLMEDFNEKHPNKIDENIIKYAKSS